MLAVAYYLQTIKDRFAAADKERGATAVEYGLMVAAIAVAIIAVVFLIGDDLNRLFTQVSDKLAGAGGGTTA